LVIAWLRKINPITLFLQTQRGFFFFSVVDRGGDTFAAAPARVPLLRSG
jgi:hypothetical protein